MKADGISSYPDSIPQPEDIRKAVQEVLQNPDFDLGDGSEFTYNPLLERIGRFISDLIGSLSRLIHSIFDVSPVLGVLFIFMLLAICVLLIWHIIYTFRAALAKKTFENENGVLPEEKTEIPDIWEHYAQEAAGRQDFITAVRALLYAGLLHLELKNQQRLLHGKTNREYLRKYSNTSVSSPLSFLVATVEQKWYGRGVCSAVDYQDSLNAFTELKKYSGTV